MNATQIRNLLQNRAIRFALVQLAHTIITVIALAALVLGAARVGALNGLMASAAPAAGPSFTTINYQGRLADSGGNPINNTNPGIGMTFALYAQESGGSPVWTETHANVPVSNGLFSVRLGSVNALSTDVLTGDRWLGIQAGTDPEMSPREKLAAMPYAMQAGLALTVPDGAIGTMQIADGSIKITDVSLDTWGILARSQGLMVMPEGQVTDDGNGNVTLGLPIIIMNPLSGTFIRVRPGTYHLDPWGYLYVNLPPSVPEYANVDPQTAQWVHAARTFEGYDKFVLAQRMASGPVWFRFGWTAR